RGHRAQLLGVVPERLGVQQRPLERVPGGEPLGLGELLEGAEGVAEKLEAALLEALREGAVELLADLPRQDDPLAGRAPRRPPPPGTAGPRGGRAPAGGGRAAEAGSAARTARGRAPAAWPPPR